MGWADQLSTGLMEDFDFYITKAYFAPDQGYQKGEALLLQLHGIAVSEGEVFPDHREIFSVGADWITTDNMRKIQSTKGAKGPNKNSMLGRLVLSVVEISGSLMESRGDITDANVWTGTAWHFHINHIEFGRGLNAVDKNFPTAFIGVSPDNWATMNAQTQAPIPTPAPMSMPQPLIPDPLAEAQAKVAAIQAQQAAQTNGLGLNSQLISIAKSSSSFDEFAAAAIDLPGVTSDNDLLVSVMDAEPGGFYAVNHA